MVRAMDRRKFAGLHALLGLVPALFGQRYDPLPRDPGQTVGFAEADITPDLGMERPGNYGKVFHRRVFDPCKVRAAVFGTGAARVALVGVDALVIPRQTVLGARNRIRRQCGMDPGSIMIAASHSHSSGPTGMVLPGQYDHAGELVRSLAYDYSSCADPAYLRLVEDRIVSAVCQADAARVPAACGFGSGSEAEAGLNRRFRMRNGLTYTHPRQGNPDTVGPAGPTDPAVGVIGAWDAHGRLLGCIVNYACHATAGPPGVSANWIYWMERVIRGAYGPDAIVVFLAGANGDVTQVDNLSPHQAPSGGEAQRFVGGRVGAEAVKALLSMTAGPFGPLAHRSSILRIPRRSPSAPRLADARDIAASSPDPSSAEWVFAKETVLLDALLEAEPDVEVEIQAIQIGPAVMVANPAEYFVEYGLQIKRESPFPLTMPVELANGFVGYVPTEEAFGPNGGGYETRLTSYSNLEILAGNRIAAESITLVRGLAPGSMPEAPAHREFRGPWSYGNLGPQVE